MKNIEKWNQENCFIIFSLRFLRALRGKTFCCWLYFFMNISIEDQLGLISFEVDKEKHIKVETSICRQCVDKPCLSFCPSKRFTLEKGEIKHDYEGCLECGSCKFTCPKGAVDFSYPRGGMVCIINMDKRL